MKNVRQFLGMMILLIAATVCLPTTVQAWEHESTDVAYPVEGGNIWFRPSTGEIVDADESIIKADIPEKINEVSVTGVGAYAFNDCSGLTSISIPASLTSLGEAMFGAYTGLTEFQVDPNNEIYTAKDGVLLSKDEKTLLRYPAGKTGAYTVPNSVTSFAEWAFYNCTGPTSITIPASVTDVGPSVFYGCTGLTSVIVGNGVTSIAYQMFSECNNLTIVTIPASVTSIGTAAFYDCTGLSDVYYGGSEVEWKEIGIEDGNAPLVNANIHYNSVGPDENIKPGDFDGDGRVNNKDVSRLLRALVRGEVSYEDRPNMDLNNDGRVNNKDLSLLLQALVGKDIGIKIG